MKITCDRCNKTYSSVEGGYAVKKNKNLCPTCWKEFVEMVRRHYNEETQWWNKEVQ